MTQSVTVPALQRPTLRRITYPSPLVNYSDLSLHIFDFLAANPHGVRNSDVGRAIGYNDTRQWFSYGLLERLQQEGKIRKDPDTALYFLATEQR